jgi:hypothetical protein
MEKNAVAQKLRMRLEAVREKMLRKFGEKGTRIILIAGAAVLSLIILLVIGFFLIRINEFEIKGDGILYGKAVLPKVARCSLSSIVFWRIAENRRL